jgi:hypothetical protein
MMMNMRVVALLLLLVSPLSLPKGEAATATVKFTLDNTHWVDLGAGPMLLTFRGTGVYAVGDVTPAIPTTEGFTMISGDSFYVSSTSHVWGMAKGSAGVTAYVAAY